VYSSVFYSVTHINFVNFIGKKKFPFNGEPFLSEPMIFSNKDFIFNKYKTVKTYQSQQFPVPKLLGLILKKWIKINQNDYFLIENKKWEIEMSNSNLAVNELSDFYTAGLLLNEIKTTDWEEVYYRFNFLKNYKSNFKDNLL
jgi:hypothetical protein